MNFLSHYYVHHRSSEYFNFGLLFPDILGGFSRDLKLGIFKSQYNGGNLDFLEGVAHHELADGLWHNHAYFTVKRAEMKEILIKHGLDQLPYRPFFITHIILELLLDRMLLSEKNGLGEAMYNSLEKLPQEFLLGLFEDKEVSESFCLFFQRFLKARFVLNYIDDDKFMISLNQLFTRINQPSIAFSESNKFVQELDQLVRFDYKTVLNEISDQKND